MIFPDAQDRCGHSPAVHLPGRLPLHRAALRVQVHALDTATSCLSALSQVPPSPADSIPFYPFYSRLSEQN
jgi:hypothetical protein